MKLSVKKSIYIIAFATILIIASFGKAKAAVDNNDLVNLANSSRSNNNIAALKINSELEQAAIAKAQDMFQNQYFEHTSPSGKTPWDFITNAGYNYNFAGENLAIGYDNDQELHNAWMNSVTHRENILNPNFTEIGIANLQGNYKGQKTTIVVQMFGSPMQPQTIAGANNSIPSNIIPATSSSASSTNIIDNLSSNDKIAIIVGVSLILIVIFTYNFYRTRKNLAKIA